MPNLSTDQHIPVLLETVLKSLSQGPQPLASVWDGTFGRGGHSQAILQTFDQAKIWAMDWDQAAIDAGHSQFDEFINKKRLNLFHRAYSEFSAWRQKTPELPVKFDAMLLDLGVSSPQLDQAERGFSFYHDGPLDMRMDQRQELRAADIVNEWSEDELLELFKESGEVLRPYRVVKAIVHDRKSKAFQTTRELAGLIERVDGWRKKGSHPATRYFLALRLAVNSELTQLRESLPVLMESLAEGGLLLVISFHSLEDRIVKNVFKSSLNQGRLLYKKAVQAEDSELSFNPRARSAKLRVFQKSSS